MAKTSIGPTTDNSMVTIHQDGVRLVSLRADGTVEYDASYKPEAAAKVFWDALAKNYSRVWGRAWLIVKALSELPEKHPTALFNAPTISLIREALRVVEDTSKIEDFSV